MIPRYKGKGVTMLPVERRKKITAYIEDQQSVRVIDLSREFGVTEETIRRDLEKLEKEGVLIRTHGGATPIEKELYDEPHSVRSRENIENKKKIGMAIKDLINEGEIVMMDSSTTSLEIAKCIGNSKTITMITNSMGLAMEMVEFDKIQMICIGGTLRRNALSLIGPSAKKSIKNYYADKVILSCKGMDLKRGVMESNELEAEIKKAMIDSAKTVILAIDHTKFNQFSIISLYDLSKVDIVVTDKQPSKEWVEAFQENDVEYIVV